MLVPTGGTTLRADVALFELSVRKSRVEAALASLEVLVVA